MQVVVYTESDEDRLESLDRFGTFTIGVHRRAGYARRSIGLLSFEGEEVEAIGTLARGGPIVTAEVRVRVADVDELAHPLPLAELEAALPTRFRRHFGEGILPDGTGAAVLRVLQELRPETRKMLRDRLDDERRPPNAASRAEQILTFEKDAVGLAISMAGLRRREKLPRVKVNEESSFLSAVEAYRISEDAAIAHDRLTFGDWEEVARGATGMAQFSDGRNSVTVFNVNREPLERTLGADLIYHHEQLDCFVLVQYKRMTEERGRLAFRPSADRNLKGELERMRKVSIGRTKRGVPSSYRLHEGACFVKLCRPATFDRHSTDLVKGLYIPLDYWDVLAASRELRGPRSGVVFSYETVDRYLTNRLFISLVREAWVGTRGVPSAELIKSVEEGVRSGGQ